MRRIRIHNDITLTWRLYSQGQPLNVSSYQNRELFLALPYKLIPVSEYTVSGNAITLTYYGMDQRIAGIYGLLLRINRDLPGMITVDCKDIFELVRSSMDTNDEEGEVEVFTVNVASDVSPESITHLYSLQDVASDGNAVAGAAVGKVLMIGKDGLWHASTLPDSFNASMMWEELTAEDPDKKIDISHIDLDSILTYQYGDLFTPEFENGTLVRIRANAPLYTNSWLSSFGPGDDTGSESEGSGGGGAVYLSDLMDVSATEGVIDGINGINDDGKLLGYSGGVWQALSVTASYITSRLGSTPVNRAIADKNGNRIDTSYLPLTGGTLTGLLNANAGVRIPSGTYLRIGDAYLSWDSTNHAIEIYELSGTSHAGGNMYSRGWLSSFGAGDDESGGGGPGASTIADLLDVSSDDGVVSGLEGDETDDGKVLSYDSDTRSWKAEGSADKNYVHTQGTSSKTWNVQHDLGKYPSVTIVDYDGNEVIGSVVHNSVNDLTITFNALVDGKAYCN